MATYIGINSSGTSTGISGHNIVKVGLNFQNAFSGLGWSRLESVGQTLWSDNIPNVTSGLMPTGASNYQLWTMTDALSSTFPVVLKWGMGINSNSLITHEFQAGTGVDLSDNLLGSTVKFSLTNGNLGDSANNPSVSHFAGSTSRFACSLNSSASNNVGRFFSIERSLSSDGSETDEFITLVGVCTNIPLQQSLSRSGSAASLITHRVMSLLNSSSTAPLVFDGNIYISPIFPILGYIGNPSKNIGITKSVALTNANTFIGNIYNINSTYMGFNGNAAFNSADGDSANRPTAIFMRWE